MILGISGYAGVGKDTVADMIEDRLGGTVARVNFADPLREMIERLDPQLTGPRYQDQATVFAPMRTYNQWREAGHDYAWCKENTDLREYMVALGAGAREHLGGDVWVCAWDYAVEKAEAGGADHIICTDVRYVNEAMAVIHLHGSVLQVSRKGVSAANNEEQVNQAKVDNYLRRVLQARGSSGEIENDQDLTQLEREVGAWMKHHHALFSQA